MATQVELCYNSVKYSEGAADMPQILVQLPDVSFGDLDEDALNQFVDYVKPALRQAIQQWTKQVNRDRSQYQKQQPAASKIPFAVTFEEFMQMEKSEQQNLRHKALHEKRDWIEHELTERNAKWMLVLGGTVERSSTSFDELPLKEEIYQIAGQKGFAPFVFVKEELVEEHNTSRWAQIRQDDYYPTVPIFIASSDCPDEQLFECGKQMSADFDTGSHAIFFDLTALESIGIDVSKHLGISNRHLSRTYDFVMSKIKIGVKTKQGNIKSTVFTVRAVDNWENSPFCLINPQRLALLGRNVLLKLRLKMLLNGECKATDIL